mmetsp:Transcript_27507/g.38715  ORF Transcript_27507/g.38715 Transcript_27507/m.38715 type:complete len:145 (+) Transcript_27507:150-584(+)
MSAGKGVPKMRWALRKLCEFGEEALKPQRVNNKWRAPLLSKRKAADLRKKALRSGTYGVFDSTTGVGWDYKWDKPGQVGTMQIRPPKGHQRERTRESRAVKIEGFLDGMDTKIEEYYQQKMDRRPPKTFENSVKALQQKRQKKG